MRASARERHAAETFEARLQLMRTLLRNRIAAEAAEEREARLQGTCRFQSRSQTRIKRDYTYTFMPIAHFTVEVANTRVSLAYFHGR